MQFEFATVEETDAHAAVLAGALEAPGGLTLTLSGPLGAGKTTWVRAFLRALGHTGVVPSPTYTLVEPYAVGEFRIWHVDLYRLQDPLEIEELGVRELLGGNAVVLFEWPERWPGLDAQSDLGLRFAHGEAESERRLMLDAASPRGEALLGRADFSALREGATPNII